MLDREKAFLEMFFTEKRVSANVCFRNGVPGNVIQRNPCFSKCLIQEQRSWICILQKHLFWFVWLLGCDPP